MKKIALFLLFAIIAAIAPLTLSAQNGEHNGHRYVDLGLPSGTKWADCNVGANSQTDRGGYYAWGETQTKSSYDMDNYKFGKVNAYTKYNSYDNNLLELEDDVAHIQWGGEWCMPTASQWIELETLTEQKSTIINGVKGTLFIGTNGNSIFLPAAGVRVGKSLFKANSLCYWDKNNDNSNYTTYTGKALIVSSDTTTKMIEFPKEEITIQTAYKNADRERGRPVRAVINSNMAIKISGTENGHSYVDLGLPSGTKWADCNVGASSPTQYGNYYAWGETTTKSNYSWDTYKYGRDYDKITKYCTKSNRGKNGFKDNKKELDLNDDVAYTQWGSQWRMPTIQQFDELIKYTKYKWVSINDKWGYLFTGRNGNSIFLPAAGNRDDTSLGGAGYFGNYWSRTLSGYYNNACSLGFYSDNVDVQGFGLVSDDYRPYGFTVRPVYVKSAPVIKSTPVKSESDLKVSSTENGHRYVDLGLPSGTKWADCNVGASSPTQYGNYYAWGEINTKSNYDWDTYKYGNSWKKLTKYCYNSKYGKNGFKDNKNELDLNDDVAHTQWGGEWRMPTKEQFEELEKYTTSKWTSINNVWGRMFTAKNGNSIFLPAAGGRNGTSLSYVYGYWSRTLNADYPNYAYNLYFYSDGVYVGNYYRGGGQSVRPVLLKN